MWGGHGHRKFYLNEADRIERERIANLPKGGYSDAQIEAGFERLQRTFGFLGTLLYMEKETPYKRHELLLWSVAEFNTNFAYLAWHGHFMEKYAEIQKRKQELKAKRGR